MDLSGWDKLPPIGEVPPGICLNCFTFGGGEGCAGESLCRKWDLRDLVLEAGGGSEEGSSTLNTPCHSPGDGQDVGLLTNPQQSHSTTGMDGFPAGSNSTSLAGPGSFISSNPMALRNGMSHTTDSSDFIQSSDSVATIFPVSFPNVPRKIPSLSIGRRDLVGPHEIRLTVHPIIEVPQDNSIFIHWIRKRRVKPRCLLPSIEIDPAVCPGVHELAADHTFPSSVLQQIEQSCSVSLNITLTLDPNPVARSWWFPAALFWDKSHEIGYCFKAKLKSSSVPKDGQFGRLESLQKALELVSGYKGINGIPEVRNWAVQRGRDMFFIRAAMGDASITDKHYCSVQDLVVDT
ncbi:uncharacterized protein LY89DRAFT_721421 [Mollisia scopiformis]|uniref:Uncharacterized protein n=1 Tax=Mollisia scopiformis TaxID=149040 RepID=A0A194WZM4_MOLSC|nr:uncharacterized protein LY89DRAFT_721421 [Mollisia scopiformis]KUJ13398.1 hypothetical protein LY89DRAFT_721421 [Mollisia scopiformis]